MKAEKLLKLYQSGELNFKKIDLRGKSFRGKNLSGIDFGHADVRGTDFSNAILTGANFAHVKAGLQAHWIIIHSTLSLLLSASSGFLSVFSGLTGAVFWGNGYVKNYTRLPGIIILVALIYISAILLYKGLTLSALRLIVINVVVLIAVAIGFSLNGDNAGEAAGYAAFTITGFFIATVLGTSAIAIELIVAKPFAIILYLIGNFSIGLSVAGEVDKNFMPAIVLAAVFPAVVSLLSISIALASSRCDQKYALVHQIAVVFAAFGGTSFRGADLSNAIFSKAQLRSVNMSQTNMTHTVWLNSQCLDLARLGDSYLKSTQIRSLVTTGQGQDQIFSYLNLEGINLNGANLQHAHFASTNLNCASLKDVDLSGAILKQVSS